MSNTSPLWTTSRLASERSTVLPDPVPSKAAPSRASTSSAVPSRLSLPPSPVPALTSAPSAAPTSSRWSSNPHRQLSPDTSPVSANSASLNVSLGLIATTSPAPAAPPSPLPAASLNTQSFLLSPDRTSAVSI